MSTKVDTARSDQRQRIVDAAVDLFFRRGYDAVRMSEVAVAASVNVSAVYRIFPRESMLLAAVVCVAADRLAPRAEPPAESVSGLADRIAEAAATFRGAGVFIRTAAGRLDPSERHLVHAHITELVDRTAADLIRLRQLADRPANLLAVAALGVAQSVSYHDLTIPDFGTQLAALVRSVLETDLPAAPEAPQIPAAAPRSRQEAILASATRLFAERGFFAVSIDDIAAATEITDPARYFAGKADILAAVVSRGDESLHHTLTRALAADPAAALTAVACGYTSFAVTNPHLIRLLYTEAHHLPTAELYRSRAARRRYLDEWAALLGKVHPGTDATAAEIYVHATQTMANRIALSHRLHDTPGLGTAAGALTRRLLRLPGYS